MEREALKLALEALGKAKRQIVHAKVAPHGCIGDAITAIKEALAQPEQEINKDGSPCPEFWDWLPKAYNFEGNGNFTKYNMEVAFLAGKQASQPEQEQIAAAKKDEVFAASIEFIGTLTGMTPLPIEVAPPEVFKPFRDFTEKVCSILTTPPQRKPLTDEEIDKAMAENKQKLFDTADNYIKMRRAYARIIEAAHGIKGEQ